MGEFGILGKRGVMLMERVKKFVEKYAIEVCLVLATLLFVFFWTSSVLIAENHELKSEISSLSAEVNSLSNNKTQLENMLETDSRGAHFDSTIVYVNTSGKKYHKKYCQYVKSSSYEKFLSDAKRDGYTPCSKCY